MSTLLMLLTLAMIVSGIQTVPEFPTETQQGDTVMKRLLIALLLAGLPLMSVAAADKLHLYDWNNYIAPETVKRFEESCKCQVVQPISIRNCWPSWPPAPRATTSWSEQGNAM